MALNIQNAMVCEGLRLALGGRGIDIDIDLPGAPPRIEFKHLYTKGPGYLHIRVGPKN